MTAYGIFGDVEASPKLVRAALSDLLEAHRRITPDGEFWIMVGVRNADTKIHGEILDWAWHNDVYVEVVTPARTYVPPIEPAKLSVSPSFMLDVVERMRHEEGGRVLVLVGGETPRTDVLRALARAKDNGTEMRDLAEAALTLILFKGDDPPPEDPTKEATMATADEEATVASLAELGEYADDESDAETAEQAQGLLNDAAEEAGIDPNDYATWAELATALQELSDSAEEPDEDDEELEEDEEPVEIDGQVLTRDSLVGKEISEIKALAKAAGIEGYSKMRREPLINALLGVDPTPEATTTTPPARKTTGGSPKAAAASNGEVGTGGSGLSAADVDRIAGAVVSKLAAVLSTG